MKRSGSITSTRPSSARYSPLRRLRISRRRSNGAGPPEQFVGSIAAKTPETGSFVTVDHSHLRLADLDGFQIFLTTRGDFSVTEFAGSRPIMTPEERARQQIDLLLQQSSRIVQGRSQINLAASPGVAICEVIFKTSEADYLSFAGYRAAANFKNAPCSYQRRMLRSGPFVPFTIIGGCSTDEGHANASIEIR
jgi:hypothetical protein